MDSSSGQDHGTDMRQDEVSLSSVYKGSEVSTTQASDSAYGSLRTSTASAASQYQRSTSSSKSPGSSLSKSSGSGSSGSHFEASHPTPTVTSYKKKEKSHKKKLGKGLSTKELRVIHEVESAANKPTDPQACSSHTSQEDKALKVAALSQALDYIDKFRKSQESKEDKTGGPDEAEINDLATNLQEASQGASAPAHKALSFAGTVEGKDQISEVLDNEQAIKTGDGFCAAVSLNDGMVMHTTNSITAILGYPKDMWISRSFIDFVHPKDRITFTNQITSGITLPLGEQGVYPLNEKSKSSSSNRSNYFYCRLRMYNGLKQGKYSIKERKTTYNPFKLGVCFKEIEPKDISEPAAADFSTTGLPPVESPKPKESPAPPTTQDTPTRSPASAATKVDAYKYGPQSVCLIITAIPLQPAYKVKDETGPFQGTFVTRHIAACTFSLVEEAAIPFIGYLPQDLEGADIFNFYHPQDIPYLKEVYETIMTEQGKPFRSKPYRFKVRNGGYIHLETDWSCFINPWSRKLEFVIGRHTVLKGPAQPNVFQTSTEEDERLSVSEEIMQESKTIQNEIKHNLMETVSLTNQYSCDPLTQNSTRRRKELASFMGSLLEEMAKAETAKVGSSSESASVVLGNISPHHDEGSSETPPSYNQLNYNDNLTRFFNSQPKTLTEKEAASNTSDPTTVEGAMQEDKSSGPLGESCSAAPMDTATSGSGGNCSHRLHKSSANSKGKETGSGDLTDSVETNGGEAGKGSGPDHQTESSETNGNGTGSGKSENMERRREEGSRSRHGRKKSFKNGDYKPPKLTEELLLMHNKGMEKKMQDLYKDSRKGELRFVKNKWRHRQTHGLKRTSHWRNKKHGQSGDLLPEMHVTTPVSNAIPLWPPFSVAGEGIPLQAKVQQAVAGVSKPPLTTIFPATPSSRVPALIPAYYIPAAPAEQPVGSPSVTSQPAGGFLVQATGQHTFLQQQTVQYIGPTLQGTPVVYQAIGQHIGQPSFIPQPPVPRAVETVGRSTVMPGVSPDLPHSVSVESVMGIQERSGRSDKASNKVSRSVAGSSSFKFQRPASRAGSRATSVKAEPGSALESNIESNASASASVKERHYHGFIERSRDRLEDNSSSEDSSSSLYSFLKSSDEYMPSAYSNNSSSDFEKEIAPPRPVLQDPFWLQNVEVTPQLILGFQMKTREMVDVLKDDLERMKKFYQPVLVNEQLKELYGDLEERGENPRALLDDPTSSSEIFSSSSSSMEGEAEETKKNEEDNKKKTKQVTFEKYAMFYGADAPLPPPTDEGQPRRSPSSAEESSSIHRTSGSSSHSSQAKGTSTSMGSSSAITIPQSSDSETEGNVQMGTYRDNPSVSTFAASPITTSAPTVTQSVTRVPLTLPTPHLLIMTGCVSSNIIVTTCQH